ncbi:hypothetical protein L7H23_01040 [Sphingopyxis sp. BSN-002]|uniref:DUF968 domain-containing protein n=1 Tax=Sphingopyxis sp. BSN-002 TaxID=2911495 RepID=UPI001EDAEBCD|nr:hypothetical protein [Sphingopyxis sp. BSN-002]QVJ07672.1 protein of unknown function (DUF968) [Sphingopyxis phage VSN-002]UKK84718.1 hypothetical protein L7H23_01040 [Sphingopyxis sp. BSN-002]
MFPKRIPKKPKRATRWRSQAHCNFVRSHECCITGCTDRPIEVAHVRFGSGAGISQKPDDFRTVSLCRAHHARQHEVGERTFWAGIDVEALIDEFCRQSPRAAQIRDAKRERELA